jgi:HK97 family phage major capsid protein
VQLSNTEEAAAEAKSLLAALSNPVGDHPQPSGQAPNEAAQARKRASRLGDQFVTSTDYQEWTKSLPSDGSRAKVGSSPPIAVDSKALITGASDTSAGAFVFNDVQEGLIELGRRPLVMRDIITVGETNSDTVEYVRVTTETNNAAPVAEAVSTVTGAKPESALAFEKVTTAVKTVAHWIPITRRALADAGQMRTYVDGFLRAGLEQELEDQMVTGDGTGENFTGLGSITGVQSQAWDTDFFVTARKARRKVRTVGRAIPNGYLLNPEDWEAMELETDAEGRYYFGGPAAMAAPRLWGLPVIESEAVPVGTGYVGDFRQLVLWDREQAQILVSDSHSDFFIRNLLVILAELRAAFGCLRPTAIVEMDLTAA